MPIACFENREETPLVLVVEPWRERYEIPHLSTAGIRYTVKEGAEDRSFSVVANGQIDFWCNADSYEIDVVHPSAYDRLSWDICVIGGWCGGIVDGEPCHVDDLFPETGIVTAEEFARLAIRADGWPDSKPLPEDHLRWLEAKFIECLGTPSADVRELRRNVKNPFEDAEPE